MLIASNSSLFGAADEKNSILFWGLLSTLAIFLLAFFLPESFPSSAIPAVYTIALHQLAKNKHGAEVASFIERGGPKHSNWRVFGIGLIWFIATLGAFLAVLLALPPELFPGEAAG